MESEQIIEKLKTFTTSELCDGFGNGRYRTMDYHIKRQVTNKNIVGRAYPVDTLTESAVSFQMQFLTQKKAM